ncbi:MAG: hypothetical protein FJ363_12430 [Gemmatimonadetes bacterium]|nr:hypothetical protein [Gemmatimonadota bacterium]
MHRYALIFVVGVVSCGEAPTVSPRAVVPADLTARAGSRFAAQVAPDVPTNFESFALGMIDAQFDWQSFGGLGASPGRSCATYDHEIGAVPPSLAGAAFTAFGMQSLRISNAVTSGCYTDQTFSSRSTDVAGQAGATSRSRDGLVDFALAGARLVRRLDASFVVASATPEARQPGLAVVVSPARGDDHRMSWVRIEDLPDGIAVDFAERADPTAPGAFQIAPVARGLDRRVPHHIRLTLDLVDGPANDTVRVYVDGALRHVGGSWETYYALDPNGRANFGGHPPAVNRLMFRTGSDAHRGIPGGPAPELRGLGFYFDQVLVEAYDLPVTPDDCKNNGWMALRDRDGTRFRNQGDCVSSVQAVRTSR